MDIINDINTYSIASAIRDLPKLSKHEQLLALQEVLTPLCQYKEELQDQYFNHIRNEAMKGFGTGQAGFIRSTDY